jgi:hypothetical protein
MSKTRKSHPPSLMAKVTVGRRLEETGAGRLPRCLRQRPRADAPAGRHREGRAVQADRPTESGVRLSQKKTWPHRLRISDRGSILPIRVSAFDWSRARPNTTNRCRRVRRTWSCCALQDELYLKLPFFGSRKMAVELGMGRHRARRLMRILGIEAHYPKPHLNSPGAGS